MDENDNRVNTCLQVIIWSLQELQRQGCTIEDFIEALEKSSRVSGYRNAEPIKDTPAPKLEGIALERRVTEVLNELGMPTNLLGYKYVKLAIITAYENRETLGFVVKDSYLKVADMFKAKKTCVEASISRAIQITWDRGNHEAIRKYFGNTVSQFKRKPSNSQWISMLVNNLKLYG